MNFRRAWFLRVAAKVKDSEPGLWQKLYTERAENEATIRDSKLAIFSWHRAVHTDSC